MLSFTFLNDLSPISSVLMPVLFLISWYTDPEMVIHPCWVPSCILEATFTPSPKTSLSSNTTSPSWMPIVSGISCILLSFWISIAHRTASDASEKLAKFPSPISLIREPLCSLMHDWWMVLFLESRTTSRAEGPWLTWARQVSWRASFRQSWRWC